MYGMKSRVCREFTDYKEESKKHKISPIEQASYLLAVLVPICNIIFITYMVYKQEEIYLNYRNSVLDFLVYVFSQEDENDGDENNINKGE